VGLNQPINSLEVRTVSRNSWLHLDDLRESWLFLVIGGAEQSDHERDLESNGMEIEYWELGVGNPEQLVETTASSLADAHVHSQTELLAELLEELRAYRYQDALLVTLNQSTMQRLRAVLVAADIKTPSFRGFAHIDVESQLQSQFGQSLGDYGLAEEERRRPRVTDDDQPRVVSTGAVKRVWEVWAQVYRLVPGSSLEGVAL
jgi:hypothetical protein